MRWRRRLLLPVGGEHVMLRVRQLVGGPRYHFSADPIHECLRQHEPLLEQHDPAYALVAEGSVP